MIEEIETDVITDIPSENVGVIREFPATAVNEPEPKPEKDNLIFRVYDTALEAKVAAYNRVHKIANRLQRELIEKFRPFVGKKILTQSGLAAKVKHLNPDSTKEYHIYRYSSNYSLTFCVKTWEQAKNRYGNNPSYSSSHYAEASFNVGELDGDILKKLSEPTLLKEDFSVEEVKQLRIEEKELEEKARTALNKLYPFGKYDS